MRGILIKYCKPNHAAIMQKNGVIHFERLQTFIEQEDENGEYVIADALEGAIYRNPNPKDVTVTLTDPSGKRFILPKEKIQYHFTNYAVENWGVCSFTFLDFERDFDILERNEEHAVLKIKSDICKNLYRLTEGGTRIPVIINTTEFLNHIFEYFHGRGEPFRFGNVKYYSLEDSENIKQSEYRRDAGQIMFYKNDKYAYQREYRIGIVHPINKHGKNIELGNLRKCVLVLDKPNYLNYLRIELSNNEKGSLFMKLN